MVFSAANNATVNTNTSASACSVGRVTVSATESLTATNNTYYNVVDNASSIDNAGDTAAGIAASIKGRVPTNIISRGVDRYLSLLPAFSSGDSLLILSCAFWR